MAALLNCFKQAWTSILEVFRGCCGKQANEAPTTTTVEIKAGPDGEVSVTTLDTQLAISSGGTGETHAEVLSAELKTSTGTTTRDLLATSMISSGGSGSTHDTTL